MRPALPAAVAADNPVLWYELNETAGTIAYDSSSAPHNGVYQGGVALGQSGPVTDAVTLANVLGQCERRCSGDPREPTPDRANRRRRFTPTQLRRDCPFG